MFTIVHVPEVRNSWGDLLFRSVRIRDGLIVIAAGMQSIEVSSENDEAFYDERAVGGGQTAVEGDKVQLPVLGLAKYDHEGLHRVEHHSRCTFWILD